MASKVSRIRTRAATSMALIGSSARRHPDRPRWRVRWRHVAPARRTGRRGNGGEYRFRIESTISSTSATRSATRPHRQSGWCIRNGSPTDRPRAIVDRTNRTGSGTPIRTARAALAHGIVRSPTGSPQYSTLPPSADSRPNSTRVSVVLPEPEPPITAGTPPLAPPRPRRTAPDGDHVSRHTFARPRPLQHHFLHRRRLGSTSLCTGFRSDSRPTSCACRRNDNVRVADGTSLCPLGVRMVPQARSYRRIPRSARLQHITARSGPFEHREIVRDEQHRRARSSTSDVSRSTI